MLAYRNTVGLRSILLAIGGEGERGRERIVLERRTGGTINKTLVVFLSMNS